MADTFKLIRDLQESLSPDADLPTAEGWWDFFGRIEVSFYGDAGHGGREKELLTDLKAGLSDDMLAVRKGLIPDLGKTRRSLSALQSSVERRTVGVDGWPLRR